MKKKLMALVLSAALVLGMGSVASAETTYQDMSSVNIKKVYNLENEGTISPAETFQFTATSASVTDAADGITVANMPQITGTISVSYAQGEAGGTNKEKNVTVNLPAYDSVGIYKYTLKEQSGTTAGVSYNSGDITLVVTVIEENGKIRVGAVHTESPVSPSYEENSKKTDKLENKYSAGSLSVAKTVTGNLGDKSKPFNITVTFTAPAGTTVKAPITYTVAGGDSQILSAETLSANITLKHGQTATFNNVPYGVTYTVAEEDYTPDYVAAVYAFSDEGDVKTMDHASETVTITNNKEKPVDTGINLDSLPYIMILVVIAGAAVAFLVSKRRRIQ